MRGKGRSRKRRHRYGAARCPNGLLPPSSAAGRDSSDGRLLELQRSDGRGRLLTAVAEVRLTDPHAMQHDGDLARERDLATLGSSPLGNPHAPGPQGRHFTTRVISTWAPSK